MLEYLEDVIDIELVGLPVLESGLRQPLSCSHRDELRLGPDEDSTIWQAKELTYSVGRFVQMHVEADFIEFVHRIYGKILFLCVDQRAIRYQVLVSRQTGEGG